MIGKTIGNYKIISEIGKGGMGVVYSAEHINLGRCVAVKCLAPSSILNRQLHERFYQEARNQAKLQHPNIVQVTDLFEQDGLFFLVMEYVNGQGLDDIIKNRGKLSEQESLPIFKDVLTGLNFAHSKGIIHRDVKPSNILVDRDGRAKILDFGISVQTGDRRLTITGTDVGTACYMSPEQITRPRNIDHRSDVYSAGILLYEMLTGVVPFDSDTDSDYEIKEKHCRLQVPDPIQKNTRISKQLAGLILKALEKNPDNRFSGCGEFESYIEAYEKEKIPLTPKGKKKNTGIIFLISLFILLGVGFGYYITQKITEHKDESARLEERRKQAKVDIEQSQRVAQDAERERLALDAERKRQEEERKQLSLEKESKRKKEAQEAERKRQESEHERSEQERKRKEEAQEAERERQKSEARERLEQERKRKEEEERLAQETERKQSPVAFIRSYYDDLNRRDVISASGKWKKPPSKLPKMIANIDWFKVNNLDIDNENSDSACVRIDVTGKSLDGKPEGWLGTIDLEKVDGEWKIVKLNLVRG